MSDTYSQLIELLDDDAQPAPIKPQARNPALIEGVDVTPDDTIKLPESSKMSGFSAKKIPLKRARLTHPQTDSNSPARTYKLNDAHIKSTISIRRKFTSVIRPDYKRHLKRLAFDRDCDPCDILEEALTYYFDSLDRKK